MSDDVTMRPWIRERICEALDQANLARLVASDLDDHALISATIRLAEDLEAFAISLAARLSEIGEAPAAPTEHRRAAGVRHDVCAGRP
jgi:hypothetical protein